MEGGPRFPAGCFLEVSAVTRPLATKASRKDTLPMLGIVRKQYEFNNVCCCGCRLFSPCLDEQLIGVYTNSITLAFTVRALRYELLGLQGIARILSSGNAGNCCCYQPKGPLTIANVFNAVCLL